MAGLDRRRRRRPARPALAEAVGRAARGASRARGALRHGRLEPRPPRDRRALPLRPPARARLDRSRGGARGSGRGLAVRDRLQVRIDDRAQLLRRRVLGQDRRRRLALRRHHRSRLGARGTCTQGRLGSHRPRAARRGRPLLGADRVRPGAGGARRDRHRAHARARRRHTREMPRRAWRQPGPDARSRDRQRAREGPRQADLRGTACVGQRRPVARAADRRVHRKAGHRRAARRRRAPRRALRLRRRPPVHPLPPGHGPRRAGRRP